MSGWLVERGSFMLRMTPSEVPAPRFQRLSPALFGSFALSAMNLPNTSDRPSLIESAWLPCRPEVCWVTPWVSSCPVTSSVVTPSPKAICSPSQNALRYGHCSPCTQIRTVPRRAVPVPSP